MNKYDLIQYIDLIITKNNEITENTQMDLVDDIVEFIENNFKIE